MSILCEGGWNDVPAVPRQQQLLSVPAVCHLASDSHVMSHVQIVPLCPSKVPMRRPSSDRHRLADRSFAQLMRRSPSRLNLHSKRRGSEQCAARLIAGRRFTSSHQRACHAWTLEWGTRGWQPMRMIAARSAVCCAHLTCVSGRSWPLSKYGRIAAAGSQDSKTALRAVLCFLAMGRRAGPLLGLCFAGLSASCIEAL